MSLSKPTLGLTTHTPKFWLLQTILVALGFNSIFLLWLVRPAVDPTQYTFYHWSGNPRVLFLTIALDMAASWFVLVMLLVIGRKPGRTRVAIWGGLILFTPWFVYQNWCFLFYIHPYRKYSWALFFGAFLATSFLTARRSVAFFDRFERAVAYATTILSFVGVFGALLFCRGAWYGWQAHLISERVELHQQQALAVVQPHRIIWILLDELSYQQLYEQRFPGLQLPAFDALAKQSTVFSDVIPFYIYTEIVLPGLLTGKPFDKLKTYASGQITLFDSSTDIWQRFNQHDTVFQDALNAGYSTAIAGWYNPYCRIMPQVLDQCSWSDLSASASNGMISSATVVSNTKNALEMLSCFSLYAAPYKLQHGIAKCRAMLDKSVVQTAPHIMDYENLFAASKNLLRDRSASFVLLHLPVPHPGGIYDRSTGKLTDAPSSYIDNLALADKCLAGLRRTLEETGQWDSSTIVVMGDHGWRTTQLWKAADGWSKEDQQASNGGQYDPRPAYIVKLPNQTTGVRIDTPYHSVNTRKLFDRIMARKINTPADLAAWAQSVH